MKNKKIIITLISIITILIISLFFSFQSFLMNNVDKLLGSVNYPTSNGIKISCDSNSINVGSSTTCTLTGYMTGGASGISGTLETSGGITLSNIDYSGWNNYGTSPELTLVNSSGTTSGNQFVVATMTITGVSAGNATLSFVGNAADDNKVIISDSNDNSVEVADASYTITVTSSSSGGDTPSLSSDNTLKSLKVNSESVSLTNSTITVTNDVSSVNITATPNDTKATVSGDIGTKAVSVGNNTFNIVVTAENGSIRTYQLVVIRQQSQAKSSINTLKTLTVSNATIVPTFNSSITSYTTTVDNSVESVNIGATVTDNSSTIISGTGTKSLSVGINIVEIDVKAENGDIKTYLITITRKEEETISEDTSKSSDNKLKSLKIDDATLIPTFDSSKEQNYVAVVEDDASEIKINATANSSKATISYSEELTNDTLTMSTNEETKNINIIVTAENGSKKYISLTVMRKSYYDSHKDEVDNNVGNITDACTLELTSSVYTIDNNKLEINNVNKDHSIDTIKSNLTVSCGNIMVNENKVVLSSDTQVKEYTINRVWIPQTGQKVIKYTIAIIVLLGGIGGLIFYKKKMEK